MIVNINFAELEFKIVKNNFYANFNKVFKCYQISNKLKEDSTIYNHISPLLPLKRLVNTPFALKYLDIICHSPNCILKMRRRKQHKKYLNFISLAVYRADSFKYISRILIHLNAQNIRWSQSIPIIWITFPSKQNYSYLVSSILDQISIR